MHIKRMHSDVFNCVVIYGLLRSLRMPLNIYSGLETVQTVQKPNPYNKEKSRLLKLRKSIINRSFLVGQNIGVKLK